MPLPSLKQPPARIQIQNVRPQVDCGRYPVKSTQGEPVEVSANIFKDGHDILAGRVLWRPCDKKTWAEARLTVDNPGLDRRHATIVPTTLGRHEVLVEAWTDHYATWRHKAEAKLGAGEIR